MENRQQPNIILMLTDQHRLSALGCYGDTPCQTPNLDKLASEGIRFETAYTVCPVCSPARATVMTGLYPHAHGICCNIHNLGSSIHELTDREELLSRRLQSVGYQCGYTGKWHLGTDQTEVFHGPNKPSLPKDVGFIGHNLPGHGNGGFDYPEYKNYLESHNLTHEVEVMNKIPGKRVLSYGGILSGPVESTVPYFLADKTISLVDEFAMSDSPFFVWHNFWGPHSPRYAPKEFYDIYRDMEIPEWPNYRWDAKGINRPHQVKVNPYADQLTWDDWAEAVRYYYAFTSLIDQQIGRIINHLETTGLLENTIIIFAADHGETLGSHGGLMDKGWHHFEETHRIPFIVRLPEQYNTKGVQPGKVLSQWVSLVDLYPTILDMAGTTQNKNDIHGRSLLPILEGHLTQWRDTIFIEFNGVNSLATTMVTVRKANIKYGWNCSNWDELYDLEQDPHEMNNLISVPAYSGRLQEMREVLEDWMKQTGHPALSGYKRSRMGRYE